LGTYWINLTDLPAGLYYYTWYAVNSSGYWGKSDTWVYEIKKAPPIIEYVKIFNTILQYYRDQAALGETIRILE